MQISIDTSGGERSSRALLDTLCDDFHTQDEESSGTSYLISALPGLMTSLGAETPTLTLLLKVVSILHLQEISPGHVKVCRVAFRTIADCCDEQSYDVED